MQPEKSHEFKKPINERLLRERFKKIIKEFNWQLFYDILERYKRKSGLKVPTKEEKELVKEEQKKIYENFSMITGEDVEIPPDHPEILFSKRIESTAQAMRSAGRRGTIQINIAELEKNIKVVVKNLETKKIKVDFDIVYIYCLKVLFHELTHLHGQVGDIRAGYNSMNEAITEMLSQKMMEEYMAANGDGMSVQVSRMFYEGLYQVYDDEKSITGLLIRILSDVNENTSRVLIDALYSSYLNDFDVSDERFIDLLPENLREIWRKFLNLEDSIEDIDDHEKEIEEIYEELEKIIKEQKIKPLT